MKELFRVYKPMMVILLETKTSGQAADAICSKLGLSCWGRSEAQGYRGGIWVLWLDVVLKVEFKHVH